MARPIFTIENSKTESRFSVAGDLTVQYAHEFKAFLMQVLEQPTAVKLAFEEAGSIDTASVQIIYAVKNVMEKRGRQVHLSWPVNESVLDLLTKTGITKIL